MSRLATPQIISANALLSGEVIYLTKTGSWSLRHGEALMIDEADNASKLLDQVSSQTEVVGTYLAKATRDDCGQAAPMHYRDIFRAQGPSNQFHGKQADLYC